MTWLGNLNIVDTGCIVRSSWTGWFRQLSNELSGLLINWQQVTAVVLLRRHIYDDKRYAATSRESEDGSPGNMSSILKWGGISYWFWPSLISRSTKLVYLNELTKMSKTSSFYIDFTNNLSKLFQLTEVLLPRLALLWLVISLTSCCYSLVVIRNFSIYSRWQIALRASRQESKSRKRIQIVQEKKR